MKACLHRVMLTTRQRIPGNRIMKSFTIPGDIAIGNSNISTKIEVTDLNFLKLNCKWVDATTYLVVCWTWQCQHICYFPLFGPSRWSLEKQIIKIKYQSIFIRPPLLSKYISKKNPMTQTSSTKLPNISHLCKSPPPPPALSVILFIIFSSILK